MLRKKFYFFICNKADCQVISSISETLKSDNNYLSNLRKNEQNLAEDQNRALEKLEINLNETVQPLSKINVEISRAAQIIEQKLKKLKQSKDQRHFTQCLKIDEIQSTIEKERHT